MKKLLFLLLLLSAFCAHAANPAWTDITNGALLRATNVWNVSNIRYWGAIPDNGVTDNSIAISNAVRYATNNGLGRVFIPSGRYKISQAVDLPSNIELCGEGSASVLFETVTNNYIIDTYHPSTNVYIHDLTIEGAGQFSVPASGRGAIKFWNGTCNSRIERVNILHPGTSGIAVEGNCPGIVIADCVIDAAQEHGIYFSGSGIIRSCLISGTGGTNSQSAALTGIKVFGATNLIIADCTIVGGTSDAISIQAGCTNVVVSRNTILRPGEAGVSIRTMSVGLGVYNNVIYEGGTEPIVLIGGFYNEISRNTIFSDTHSGVTINPAAVSNRISDNLIIGPCNPGMFVGGNANLLVNNRTIGSPTSISISTTATNNMVQFNKYDGSLNVSDQGVQTFTLTGTELRGERFTIRPFYPDVAPGPLGSYGFGAAINVDGFKPFAGMQGYYETATYYQDMGLKFFTYNGPDLTSAGQNPTPKASLTGLGDFQMTTLTITNNITLQTTNAAPAGFVLGTTLPVVWFAVTNAGNKYLIPGFAP